MELSEKEIEDFIFTDLTENCGMSLYERGFKIPALRSPNKVIWKRQLNIDPYGIVDIVGFYRFHGKIHFDLLELKACPIDTSHFDQVLRYRVGIAEYLKGTFNDVQIVCNAFLIGNGYSSGRYIQNVAPVGVFEFEYSLDGISFNLHNPYSGWHITNTKSLSFRKLNRNGQKVH